MARWEHRNAPGNPAARAGYLIAVSRLRKALLVIALSGVAWTNAPAPRGVPASCEPGPERVDQLEMHDGYLRARRSTSGPHNEFYFARAMYSHSASLGSLYRAPVMHDNHPIYSFASFQVTSPSALLPRPQLRSSGL